jgi:hypothetical protein
MHVDVANSNSNEKYNKFLVVETVTFFHKPSELKMIFSRVVREHLTVNAQVATVVGSIPASSDTVESEGRQTKQCWKCYKKTKKLA